MESNNKLTKKDYLNTTLRAYLLQNAFNYSNYQGVGYANILYPALRKMYKDDEQLKKALIDNIEFYNTNPHFVPFVSNLQLVMLENGRPIEEGRSMKMALMGPLAGIGDSLSQFLLAPLFSTICATMALQGHISGPIIFLLGLNIILLVIKLVSGNYGYKLGTNIIETVSEKMNKFTYAASIVGVTVISALATKMVKLSLPFTYTQMIEGKEQIVQVQKMIDGIAPALLPICYTALIYYLLKKKKWNTYYLVIFTIVLSVVATFFKIFV
ncbi:PTS system mannose/fructose/sorbose family transporter subunit IID [Sneathia sanguinegens]|jgi:hypothetical protein|uniref:PTS system mannose/fructose/sorbose family transporter subunit IID n=1 Tax=Sneathia sanguinegens TaxID=40543 RepID=UPI000836F59D|nr:PTS system mannose/fructose/sorbose family transporter subunit IID [Sneathia sanguinegens]MDU7497004.1 PTS system mannose/fructose/sorbose family transporter subunit IID [Sneathia sanguinegens]